MQEIIVPEIRLTTGGFYPWELVYPDAYGTVTVEIFHTEAECRSRLARISALDKLRKKNAVEAG